MRSARQQGDRISPRSRGLEKMTQRYGEAGRTGNRMADAARIQVGWVGFERGRGRTGGTKEGLLGPRQDGLRKNSTATSKGRKYVVRLSKNWRGETDRLRLAGLNTQDRSASSSGAGERQFQTGGRWWARRGGEDGIHLHRIRDVPPCLGLNLGDLQVVGWTRVECNLGGREANRVLPALPGSGLSREP